MPDFLAETLTWPHNYYLTCAVETAVKMGLPPTCLLIVEGQPSAPWSSADKKLAIAWTILQHETCGTCGNPLWICRSDDKNLQFKSSKNTCYADAEYQKAQKAKQNQNMRPGQFLSVIPYMADGSALPSRRSFLSAQSD